MNEYLKDDRKSIIVDIDGTITNDAMSIPLGIDVRTSKDEFYQAMDGYNPSWIYYENVVIEPEFRMIESKELELQYGKAKGIRLNYPVIYLIRKLMNSGVVPFFVTAREDDEKWSTRYNTLQVIRPLFKNYPNYDDNCLLMRPYGDYRLNYEVKEELINTYVKPRFDILFAMDDEDENVKMFQRNGILALQVRNGEVNAL